MTETRDTSSANRRQSQGKQDNQSSTIKSREQPGDKHLLFCLTLVVVLLGGGLGLGHFTGEINKLFIFEGFGDVMSIFKVALDVEEGLFFDFGVGSISLGRPSWLEGVELHGWFLDGWFFGCIIVGRLLVVDVLVNGLSRAD
jgi:hypothetical protein